MPRKIGRKYYRRRRRYKKRVTKTYKRYVKRQLSSAIETKISDVQIAAGTSVSSTMSFTLLNGLTQGTNQSQRLGNEVTMIGFRIRGQFVVGDATNLVRMLIIMDKQSNNTTPAVTDIFQFSLDPYSPINEDQRKRFQIVDDRSFDLSTSWQSCKHINFYKRVPHKVYYNGTGATISNIKKNSLYLCLISDSGAVSHPTFVADIRLYYKDG